MRGAVFAALLAACSADPQQPNTNLAGSGGSVAPPSAGQSGASTGASAGASGSVATSAGAGAGAGTSAPPTAGSAGTSGTQTGGSGGVSGAAGTVPVPQAGISGDPPTAPLIPNASWHCNMPEGIPYPDSGEFVFEMLLELGTIMDLGATQYGMRRVLPITGGSITGSTNGPEIEGTVLNGGLEWELTTTDGSVEIEARNIIRAGSSLIYIRTCGAGTPEIGERVVLDIEAPSSGSYASLQQGTYVAARVIEGDRMRLRVFKTAATSPMPKPATLGPGDQPWDCRFLDGGTVGSTPVLEAAVNIGGSLAVGASKYGRRNIIPITGGTFTGEGLMGTVISGGADFQLTPTSGSGLQIEARYTIRTNDGDLIAVRNCGGSGGTRLMFETRAAGPYAFLNADGYTGRIGLRLGGVLISVFK